MHVSRICSDLVKIRSENPPGRTREVIEYIRVFLERLGIRSAVSGNAGGMCNLVTEMTGTGLLLCGHVDVVPALDAGWANPPFSGKIDDRYVHGRGATDMKGGCAAMVEAWLALGEALNTEELPTVGLLLVVGTIIFKRFQASPDGKKKIDQWKMSTPVTN